MNSAAILRGRIYAIKGNSEECHYLVVSNNPRNLQLPHVLAIPLTADAVPATPSIVAIPKGEVFIGHALCDNIKEVSAEEIASANDLGQLSRPTMQQICDGLRAALAL
jgi:mRNA-degrading endonuclease toxin of MazEF toxin-antitoxin module